MEHAYLKVKVHANAKENHLVQKAPDGFDVFVKEPADRGRANKAVLALLAKHLHIAMGKLWIVKGAHSPAKIVAVRKYSP